MQRIKRPASVHTRHGNCSRRLQSRSARRRNNLSCEERLGAMDAAGKARFVDLNTGSELEGEGLVTELQSAIRHRSPVERAKAPGELQFPIGSFMTSLSSRLPALPLLVAETQPRLHLGHLPRTCLGRALPFPVSRAGGLKKTRPILGGNPAAKIIQRCSGDV